MSTFKLKINLFGTLIILAAIFWMVNFVIPDSLTPPSYDNANLNEVQVELMEKYLAKKKTPVATTQVDGREVYLFVDNQKWTFDRPDWLDENNQPILSEEEKLFVAKNTFVTDQLPAWFSPDRPISYLSYNKIQKGLTFLLLTGCFFGFLASQLIFAPSRIMRQVDRYSYTAIITVMCLTLILQVTDQILLNLIFFGTPFICMLLLWTLIRPSDRPKESEVVEKEGVTAT